MYFGSLADRYDCREQLMLHDFVGRAELPSTVRLNATFRSLGVLFGPVVGSVLLLGLGPVHGIFVNIAFYLPLTLFLFYTRFTGHVRDHGAPRPRVGLVGSLQTSMPIFDMTSARATRAPRLPWRCWWPAGWPTWPRCRSGRPWCGCSPLQPTAPGCSRCAGAGRCPPSRLARAVPPG